MDHSVKAMNSHRKVAFSRLFNRRRFENKELEALYQRYIFKLNHSSILSTLALFIVLTATLAGLQFYYEQTITIIGLYCLLQCLAFVGLFLLSFKMHDHQLLALCYVILLFCVIFCIVFAPVNLKLTHKTDSAHQNSSLTLEENHWFVLKLWNVDHLAVEGVWQTVFVIFLTYTMLPIKTRISLFIGSVLSIGHLTVTLVSRHVGSYRTMTPDQVSEPLTRLTLATHQSPCHQSPVTSDIGTLIVTFLTLY